MISSPHEPSQPTARPVLSYAYYLPQFYPMALNSRWWGEGYTEWNAVLKSQRGWRLPRSCHLTPGTLGFYDLRSKAIREEQGNLARASGLSAFAIYHYWSNGDRPLDEVEDLILSDGQPDHPFFFFWANHDWTLAWAGKPEEVTFAQSYSSSDDATHIAWMSRSFSDQRYHKIRNMPVIGVYRPLDLPNPKATFDLWRQHAVAQGYSGLVILGVSHDIDPPSPPTDIGLTAWVQTSGPALSLVSFLHQFSQLSKSPVQLARAVKYRDRLVPPSRLRMLLRRARHQSSYPLVPMVVPSWSNTGRRSVRSWYLPADPEEFKRSLEEALEDAPLVENETMIVVNAWNEWGELMTLEPSIEFGTDMLGVLRSVLAECTDLD